MKNKKHTGKITGCQICNEKKLVKLLTLGHQPVVQEYLSESQLSDSETTYPLNLCRCTKCGLVQIDYIVDPKVVFPDTYPYRTGLTNMLIKNFESLSENLKARGYVKNEGLIIDIGSNDGTLLKPFQKMGMRVLGVEPTNAAKTANENGIKTIQKYFDQKTVANIINKFGKAKIITATNVFAHINDTHSLIKNIAKLMDKDSVFVSESQYLVDIIEKLEFDTVYHEHLRFYSLKPLIKLFELAGMSIVDAERIHAAGGSIRVFAVKGNKKYGQSVVDILKMEEEMGIYDDELLFNFSKKVLDAKFRLLSMVLDLKRNGSKIIGLSSAARSNTLLGFTTINHTILDYLVEKKGSPKIGLYTPGTHIPIVDESYILKDNPDYILVLSWHIGEELIKKIRDSGYKGKFIVPLPVPKII